MFLFRDATAETLSQSLQIFGAQAFPYDVPAQSPFWVYPIKPLLELHIIHSIAEYEIDLTADTYLKWWAPLKAALGCDPASAARIHVSEGEAAAQAIRRVARLMLEQHTGIVQDDQSSHAWTLTELRLAATWNGNGFFQWQTNETP
jgi:hypothetical protein